MDSVANSIISVLVIAIILIIVVAIVLAILYFMMMRNSKAMQNEKLNYLKHSKLAEDELRSAQEDINKLQTQKETQKELVGLLTNNIELTQNQHQALIENARKHAKVVKWATRLAEMRGENLDKDLKELAKAEAELLEAKESKKDNVIDRHQQKPKLVSSISVTGQERQRKKSQHIDENWDDPKNRDDVTSVDKTRKRKVSAWTKVKDKLISKKDNHKKHRTLKFRTHSDETSQDGMEEVDGMSECSSYTSSAVKNMQQSCHKLDDAVSTFTELTSLMMMKQRLQNEPKLEEYLTAEIEK